MLRVIAVLTFAALLSGCLTFVINREVEECHHHPEAGPGVEAVSAAATAD